MSKKHTGDLTDYDPRFVRCRGLRNHTWQFHTDFDVTTKGAGKKKRITEFKRTLHCIGCTTNRIDTYRVRPNGSFEFVGHEYKYADGYQLTRGNKIETAQAREQLIMMELGQSLSAELLKRFLEMRPDAQAAIAQGAQPRLRVVGEK